MNSLSDALIKCLYQKKLNGMFHVVSVVCVSSMCEYAVSQSCDISVAFDIQHFDLSHIIIITITTTIIIIIIIIVLVNFRVVYSV
jgi:hypothetical protein